MLKTILSMVIALQGLQEAGNCREARDFYKEKKADQGFQPLLTDYHKNICATETEKLIEESAFKNIPLKGAGEVKAISVDGKYLWLATNNGLVKFNKEDESYERFTTKDGLISDDVRDVAVDENYIWIATYYGINRHNKSTGDMEKIRGGVFLNCAVEGDNVWFVCREKNTMYNKKSGQWKNWSQGKTSIEVDGDYIWFASDYSVEKYDRKKGVWATGFSKKIFWVRVSATPHFLIT